MPVAVADMIELPVALDRVSVNASLDSTTASPATLMVMTLLVSPAAKLTVPVGSVPPKSAASTAAPLMA